MGIWQGVVAHGWRPVASLQFTLVMAERSGQAVSSPRRGRVVTTLLAFAAVIVVGCGSPVSNDTRAHVDAARFVAVAMGASQDSVTEALGEPAYIERAEDTGEAGDCWVWYLDQQASTTTTTMQLSNGDRGRLCFNSVGAVAQRDVLASGDAATDTPTVPAPHGTTTTS